MEIVQVTRTYLESLNTNDLIKLAESWGIDIPSDLDRIFIMDELLEIAAQDSALNDEDLDSAEKIVPAFDSDEPVPLPKQYNITFIKAMIRDPLWAFVFWEIKTQEREQFEKSVDFNGYYLKVSPFGHTSLSGDAFTVSVKPDDSAWYLGLSPNITGGNPPEAQIRYKVEICAELAGEEIVLAVSPPFSMPVLFELPVSPGSGVPEKTRAARENPLIQLSGYLDFHVLRKNERFHRVKKISAGEVSNE